MGQIESDNHNLSKINEQHIDYIQSYQDANLGQLDIYKTSIGNKLIAKIQTQSKEIDIQSHLALQHQNLARTWTYDPDLREIYGGEANGLYFYFDYYQVSLADILVARKKRQNAFSADEIYRIAKDILECLFYLEQEDMAHWNIQPKAIFYDAESKRMLLYNNQLLQGKYKSFYLIKDRKHNFMNPEISQSMLNRQLGLSLIHQYKHLGDIYQLGMVLIEVATLLPSIDFFNKDTFQINYDLIKKRLEQIRIQYGTKLESFIQEMIHANPRERLPAAELLQKFIKIQQEQQPSLIEIKPQQLLKSQQPITSQLIYQSYIKPQTVQYSQTIISSPQRKIQQINQRTISPNPIRNVLIKQSSPQTQKIIVNSPINQRLLRALSVNKSPNNAQYQVISNIIVSPTRLKIKK